MDNHSTSIEAQLKAMQEAMAAMETRMDAALTALRNGIQRDLQTIRNDIALLQQGKDRPVAYADQGNLVLVHENEPTMVQGASTGTAILELADGDAITIQLANNGLFLHGVPADPAAIAIDHLQWKEALDDDCLFVVEDVHDNTLYLCSAVSGAYVQIKKDASVYPKGCVATLVDDKEAATLLTMTVESGNTVRLIGPRRQHLSAVTIHDGQGRPYSIFGTRLILPQPDGLLILNKV
jgi:hypothetical protein